MTRTSHLDARSYRARWNILLRCWLLLLAMTARSVRAWEYECVDCPEPLMKLSGRCLGVDSAGNPHLALGRDELVHAWHDGSKWQFETATNDALIADYAVLELDVADRPHIAYYDMADQHVWYCYRDEQGWRCERVAPGSGLTYHYLSLALDGDGDPSIVYFNSNTLTYATKDRSEWRIEPVEQVIAYGRFCSLAIDPSGAPHISYLGTGPSLKYAERNPAGWSTMTIDEDPWVWVGWWNSIALDPEGLPHVSYCEWNHDYFYCAGVRYAFEDSSGWHVETVADGDVGTGSSIDVDGSGVPHVLYAWAGNGALLHAVRTPAGWQTEGVTGTHVDGGFSLALDPWDVPHACYSTVSVIECGHDSPPGWQFEIVASHPLVGTHNSLTIDRQGQPRIAYYDNLFDDLRYSWKAAEVWHLEVVDTVGSVGSYASIQTDAQDLSRVSYYDATNKDLRYAAKNSRGWEVETVDAAGDQGKHSSLELDGNGFPHIAYCTWSESGGGPTALRYAYADSAGWHHSSVDASGEVGEYASLALAQAGNECIAYWDRTREDLKFAYKDQTGWRIETVDSDGSVGNYASLALAPGDLPCISYFDGTCEDLKYARRNVSGWDITVVDSLGRTGRATSLAFDAAGYPHIGYWAHGDPAVKHAFQDAQGWHVELVDGSDWIGWFVSLGIGDDGTMHVTYFNEVYDDLRYATRPVSAWISLSAEVTGQMLTLSWNPVPYAAEYWVFGVANQPWFAPGVAPGYEHRIAVVLPPSTVWATEEGVQDPTADFTYLVMVVDPGESEMARSNRCGEEDFLTEIP